MNHFKNGTDGPKGSTVLQSSYQESANDQREGNSLLWLRGRGKLPDNANSILRGFTISTADRRFWVGVPPAAESHEKPDSVLNPLGLGLQIAYLRLIIEVVRRENLQIINSACPVIHLNQAKRFVSGIERPRLSAQRFSVMLQRPESICNLGKCTENGLAINGKRLVVGFNSCLFPVLQAPSMKNGSKNVPPRLQIPLSLKRFPKEVFSTP